MTTYAVAHLKNVQMGPELRSYVEAIDETLAPHDGSFIIHGGSQTPLEGELGGDLIVIAFPDRTSAENWYRSPDYQRIIPLRRNNSDGAVVLIDGVGPEHRATDIFQGRSND